MKILVKFFLIAIVVAAFLYWENNSLTVSEIDLSFAKLPKEFDGYKIVHLSDLHGKQFGANQKHLVKVIERINPDLVAVTGDLIDKRHYREEPSLALLEQLVQIAPVYLVTGNHEWESGRFASLEKKLRKRGVRVLRNDKAEVSLGKGRIIILGVDDPLGFEQTNSSENIALAGMFKGLPENDFKILLAHRPERVDLYSFYKPDLILAGHAHGGQVRLPLIGGLFSPGQGFLPKYTAGAYLYSNSTLIVSRGLGNSIIPQRLFNRPEIVVIKLAGSDYGLLLPRMVKC